MIPNTSKTFLMLTALSVLATAAEAPRVPFLFEANQGQAPSVVRYLARTKSYQVFLEDASTQISIGGRSLSVSLPGGKVVRPSPEGKLLSSTDYILGNDPKAWRLGVEHYSSVRRAQVYPGIDQLFYGNPERLEYDFIVNPGAAPGSIRIRITGGEKLKIDSKGRLIAKAGAASFIQHAPVAYQQDRLGNRQPVKARWVLADARTARIETGLYDQTRTLIIDPEIEAAGVAGGPGKDEWIALLNGFPSALVGVTDSLDYPGAFGRRGSDITIVQFNSNTMETGKVVYIGGSGMDRPLAAVFASSSAIRIVGETNSRDFPVGYYNNFSYNLQQLQPYYGGGASDGFLLEYTFIAQSTSPQLLYSTYVGGSKEDRLTAVGASVAAGETKSDDLPTFITGSYRGGWDGFYVQLTGYGRNNYSPLTGSYFGGSGDERVKVARQVDGIIVVAGSTDSPDLPVENAWQTQLNGLRDGFIQSFSISINYNGAVPVTSYWGGSGDDEITSIAFYTGSRWLIAGTTSSIDMTVTNATQAKYGGGPSDAFLLQADLATSSVPMSTYLGGSGADSATHLSYVNGGVWMAGTTTSENFPVLGSGQSTYGGGASDAFVSQFKIDFTSRNNPLISSQYIGGSGAESAFGIIGDLVAVNSDSTEGTWRGANALNSPGAGDGFVFRLSEHRITSVTDYYLGKNQIGDLAAHLGGATSLGEGVKVSIKSGDPEKLKILTSAIDTAASVEFMSVRRDAYFSVQGFADSGDVPVTISAADYPDQVILVHLVPIQYYWVSPFTSSLLLGSLKLPLPPTLGQSVQRVQLLDGYNRPGTTFVSYPGRRYSSTAATFSFRSTNPAAVTVASRGNADILIARIGPGDADIIADAGPEVNGPPPLRVEVGDLNAIPPSGPINIESFAPTASIANGVTNAVYVGTFSRNVRVRARVEDPSLAHLVDPINGQKKDEVEVFSGFGISVVGLADSGSTRLILIADGQEAAAIKLNLVPTEIRLVTNTNLRSVTYARAAAPQSLLAVLSTFRGFESLYGIDSIELEVFSSNSSVVAMDTTRLIWNRNTSGRISAIGLTFVGTGSTELSFRLVDGPSFLKIGGVLRINVEDLPTLSLSDGLVGKNLQSSISYSSQTPFPPGTTFTIESGDPTRLLVNGSGRATFSPTNSSNFLITIVGLGDSGVVPVTVSSPAGPKLTSNVQLTPSAIAISGANLAALLFGPLPFSQPRKGTTQVGALVGFSLTTYAVNSAGLPLERQPLRTGFTDIPLKVASDDPDIIPTPQVPDFGSRGSDFQITSKRIGKTRISLQPIPGFVRALYGNDVEVEVIKPAERFNSLLLSKDTQGEIPIPQGQAANWTITSLDPSKVILSSDSKTPGTASITVNSQATRTIYAQALSSGGLVTLTFTSPDYEPATATVFLQKLSISIDSSSISSDGNTLGILQMSLNSQPSVITARLPETASAATFRPGFELRLPVTVARKDVAILTGDTFILSGTTIQQSINLRALSVGKTEITVAIPPAILAGNQTGVIPVEVQGPLLRFSEPLQVLGRDMVKQVNITFANVESQGTIRLTVESSDPTRALLSADATQAGQARITITTRPNQTPIFLHVLGNDGDVVITAKSDGFADGTMRVSLRSSGLLLTLDNTSSGAPFTTILGAVPFNGRLSTRIIPRPNESLPQFEAEGWPLRPGAVWSPTITAADPSIVEVLTPKPSVATGGAQVNFRGVRTGDTEIQVAAGSDISVPLPSRVLIRLRQFNVNNSTYFTGVQLQSFIDLGFTQDTPLTITSKDPSLLRLSLSEKTTGSGTVTFPANQRLSFFIQGVAESNTYFILSAPGFDDKLINVFIGKPGFAWNPNGFTFLYTQGGPVTRQLDLTVGSGSNAVRGRYWPSPNTEIRIGFTSSNSTSLSAPAAISLQGSVPPASFTVSNGHSLTIPFQAGQAGTAKIAIVPPPGWVADKDLELEVRNSGINNFLLPPTVGKDSIRAIGYQVVGLTDEAMRSLRVRFASSDPARLVLSSSSDIPGTASLVQSPFTTQLNLHALSDNGSATITASLETAAGAPVAGFSSASASVGLSPSVWSFQELTLRFQAKSVYGLAVGLSDLGAINRQQYALRPGVTASIAFDVSDASVVSVQPNPIVVFGQNSRRQIDVSGLKPGEANITIRPVAGFAADPSVQTLRVTVQ